MQSLDVLPESPLQPGSEVTHAFLAAGVQDFRSAAQYLCQLPYGRTTRRDDCRLVLREGRGTCSTKHALLAELACEQAIDVALTIGVYAMTERNTPGVGPVLEALAARNILGGYDLSGDFPELGNCLLVCATETKSDEDLQAFADAMSGELGK